MNGATVSILLVFFGVAVLLVLIGLLFDSRERRDREVAQAAKSYHLAASTLTSVEHSLRKQVSELGYVEPQPLLDIIEEYRKMTSRKELS